MKKGMLPTQSYELINICRQTVENGTPLTCDDCGKVIFNIATIKGKQDGITYNVGLTCVKKLLNKSIYFDFETQLKYDREVYLWNNAINARKWVEKRIKDNKYNLTYKEFYNDSENETLCYIELTYKTNNLFAGRSAFLSIKYKSVFEGLF
jgi:hypothetical protein